MTTLCPDDRTGIKPMEMNRLNGLMFDVSLEEDTKSRSFWRQQLSSRLLRVNPMERRTLMAD